MYKGKKFSKKHQAIQGSQQILRKRIKYLRFNHKQHWKKKAEIPQKLGFLTWSFNISTENFKIL